MPLIEIYTSPLCGYCHRAKALLNKKAVEFLEIDVWRDASKRSEMLARSQGRTSVPQIFINGEHIGGCDELYALDMAQQLDAKLGLI